MITLLPVEVWMMGGRRGVGDGEHSDCLSSVWLSVWVTVLCVSVLCPSVCLSVCLYVCLVEPAHLQNVITPHQSKSTNWSKFKGYLRELERMGITPASVILLQPSRRMLLSSGHPVASDISTTVTTFWHPWISIETIDGHAIPSKVSVVIPFLLHSLIRIIVTGIPLPSTHLNDEWQCSYASMVVISIARKHLSQSSRSHPTAGPSLIADSVVIRSPQY